MSVDVVSVSLLSCVDVSVRGVRVSVVVCVDVSGRGVSVSVVVCVVSVSVSSVDVVLACV